MDKKLTLAGLEKAIREFYDESYKPRALYSWMSLMAVWILPYLLNPNTMEQTKEPVNQEPQKLKYEVECSGCN